MSSFKALVLVGIGAASAVVVPDSGCSSPGSPSVSTIYVTVPGSQIIKTVYTDSEKASVVSPTLTITNLLKSTEVVNAVHTTDQPGAYSFAEDDGTTTWMGGKTPPASAQLLTSTSIVTLQPFQSSVYEASEEATGATTTSYMTVHSTLTITETFTTTLTQAVSAVKPTAKAFTGFGTTGWNASSTTFLKLKATTLGSKSIKSRDPWSRPSHLAAPSNNQPHRVAARQAQVGDIIGAIIDGIAVSWTNNYDGSTPSTSDLEETLVPVTATAPAFGGLPTSSSRFSTISSPMQTSSAPITLSLMAAPIYSWHLSVNPSSSTELPTTTLAVSPWFNLQPGLHPPPSMPSDYQWVSTEGSTSTAKSAELPSSHTVHLGPHESSQNGTVTQTLAAITPSGSTSKSSTVIDSAPTSTISSCGTASAIFTVDFDDLPFFSTGPDDVDIPPIFNPYRKLYWEGHFGYVPPPTDPFPPHSPPQLAVYRGNGLNVNGSSDAGLELAGAIGAGPRADYNAYWIDAHSAWIGCADGGPNECTIRISGYAHGATTAFITQTVAHPPCPGFKNCLLTLVKFDEDFRGLTTLQITASVNSKAIEYYMDDVRLAWTNHSCAAQLLRSSSK